MHRTGAAVLLVYTVMLAATALVVQRAEAAITSPFALRYSANTNGSILLRGNSNLVCPPAGDCLNARQGLQPSGESLDNNAYTMMNADADGDLGVGTVNDSTATVTLPPGSVVLFAALYWAADTTPGSSGSAAPFPGRKNKVRFRTPANPVWQPITASTTHGNNTYQGFADVTALVAGSGNGVYGVADIQAGTGGGRFAGWTLAVAYRNPAEDLRALRIYDGFGSVSTSSGEVDIKVGGFETPHSGTVRAEIGTVVYEGDRGITGDVLKLNGTSVSDAANPANNFFNGTISDGGVSVPGRNPGWPNVFGADIDQFDATGRLGHAATSATLTLDSSGDTFYPGVVTFAIDLYAPKLTTTVTSVDVDGGALLPGDVVEYRIEVRNEGNDSADAAMISNAIPTWTSYVPGSLRVQGATVTDAAGDDAGTYAAGRADLALGSIPYQGVVRATLRVRVEAGAPLGYAITNLVNLTYTGRSAQVTVSGPVAALATPIAPAQTDLVAALTVQPAVVQRADVPVAVTYTGTVANDGTALENAATAELTLPAGLSAGALPTGCTVFAQIVTCALGPLAPGTRATVVIPATAGGTAGAQPGATLQASGSGTDGNVANDTATASFRMNLAPNAVDDTAATTTGARVTVAVLGNDDDPDGPAAALHATIRTPPGHGAAVVEADGTISYTPAATWAGDDTFRYELTDADGGSDTATVSVRTANARPVARDDADATASGAEVSVGVLGNDDDPNGDTLTVVAVSGPQAGAGSVRIDGGAIVYNPVATFVGQAVLGYTVSDGQDTAVAQVLVDVENALPTAADDLAGVSYRGSVTIPVLANDADSNADPISVHTVGAPSSGSATITPGGILYQAAPGFSGVATFAYTIIDTHLGQSTGQVTVTVANAPPTASDKTETTAYLTPVSVAPLAGAADENGDTLRVSGTTRTVHGLLAHHPDGTLTYTPDDRWSGTESFTVTIADTRGGTVTTTVTITVLNAPPVARPEATTLPSGLPSVIDVLANDEDPNGDTLGVTIDLPAAHGTATVSAGRVDYQPAAGYAGPDSFHYTVSDGRGGTSGATVTIELVNAYPLARADAAGTDTGVGVTVDVAANDSDPNGDTLTVSGWTAAAHGTVAAGPGGTLRYTPEPGFTGLDSFGYTIEDPHRASAAAGVTITVRNAAPVAVDDAYTVHQQGSTILSVLGNDSDPNTGQTLGIAGVGAGSIGTVTVTGPETIQYTPRPGSAGLDTFDYLLTDDLGGTDTGTVRVTVDAAPTAVDDTADTPAATFVEIAAAGNDIDPEQQPLTVSSAGMPANGIAMIQAAGTVGYAPNRGFTGTDAFPYVIRDAAGNTASGRIEVRVANAAPVARPDAAATRSDEVVDVDVLANDSDDNPGQTLSLSAVGPPDHGTATRVGNRISYTPPAEWTGEDRFRYVVSDDLNGLAETTVTVTVTHQIPLAVADLRATPYGRAVTVPVLDNDLDPAGSLRVTAVTTPDHGTAQINDGATVTYTPPSEFSGTASFDYTARGHAGAPTTARVTITVEPPPVAPDREAGTPPGSPVAIALPTNDGMGQPVTLGRVARPAHGTVTVNADGTITYTPDPGFIGTDRFTYEIIDAAGNVAYGTIVVTVAADDPSPDPSGSPSATPPAPSPSAIPSPSATVSTPVTSPPGTSPPLRPTAAPPTSPAGPRPPARTPSSAPTSAAPTPGAAPAPPDLPTTGRNLTVATAAGALATVLGAALYRLGSCRVPPEVRPAERNRRR
ncbi:Ig-like domain-containing protein [Actinoplanes sp. NEAU-A12]|uniref:Ig-like domain-containing protein n=1 Tax=Actinoplanes sandaracinus TaxID=3045177 RepID=A0ABT6WW81_9ACTN|nr:Ig-like domain-containing protein [Actinoplanes sandaracinus]MDI6103880.1 Ig-like domain-containing protein [Actinoplanes sandaracinus]